MTFIYMRWRVDRERKESEKKRRAVLPCNESDVDTKSEKDTHKAEQKKKRK